MAPPKGIVVSTLKTVFRSSKRSFSVKFMFIFFLIFVVFNAGRRYPYCNSDTQPCFDDIHKPRRLKGSSNPSESRVDSLTTNTTTENDTKPGRKPGRKQEAVTRRMTIDQEQRAAMERIITHQKSINVLLDLMNENTKNDEIINFKRNVKKLNANPEFVKNVISSSNQIESKLGNVNLDIKSSKQVLQEGETKHQSLKTVSNSFPKSSKDNNSSSVQYLDYYGTYTKAHFVGLKKLGWSSVLGKPFQSPYIIDPHIYNHDTITKPPGYRKKKIIACFNCPERFYKSSKHNSDFRQCPYSECELSRQNGMNDTADMMIFWQDPGISKPPKRPNRQLWTFLSWEAPPNRDYPEPSPNWRNKFNYTITYLPDADFQLPYDHLVWRDKTLIKPLEHYIDMAKRKSKSVAWMVSHCYTKSKRGEYVKELKKYIDVDIFGKCGNLTCTGSYGDDCWKNINNEYAFYLSFENTFCIDYVTEKFFKLFRFRYNILPIVRGGFDYDRYFPPNTFINTAHFTSAKQLALKLKDLINDPVKLGKLYREKDRFGILNRKIDWCDFCEKFHTGGFKKQVIYDIKKFSFSKNGCFPPPNDIKDMARTVL